MKIQARQAWRWWRNLVAGIGLFAVASAPQAQVPQHWISYAEMVSHQFAQWLSDPGEQRVVQLHAQLQERVLKQGKPPLPPLVARVWISPAGRVSRLEVPSTGDLRVDEALRGLLMARTLPETPPPDLRQPMLLQLSLDFPVAPGTT